MAIETAVKLTAADLGYNQLKARVCNLYIASVSHKPPFLTRQATPHDAYARVGYAIIAFHCAQL